MADGDEIEAGSVAWADLTVADAPGVRDFYAAVVGWEPEPVDMDGYSDFLMTTVSGAAVAGVCHARGENADLPPLWLVYLVVEDLDASVRRCVELGGVVVAGSKGDEPGSRYVVIRDPAGAVAALVERPA